MYTFTREDWIGTGVFLLILAVIAFINLRKMSKGSYNLPALRKRGLMWTQIAIGLFVVQFVMRREDTRFLIILGLVFLFAVSQWLGAMYFEKRSKSNDEE